MDLSHRFLLLAGRANPLNGGGNRFPEVGGGVYASLRRRWLELLLLLYGLVGELLVGVGLWGIVDGAFAASLRILLRLSLPRRRSIVRCAPF